MNYKNIKNIRLGRLKKHQETIKASKIQIWEDYKNTSLGRLGEHEKHEFE
jgi:hypothetical protein